MIGDRSDEIPDLAEPIEAWRCWQLKGDDKTPILHSPASGVVWPPVEGWDGNVIRDEGRNFITAKCQDAWGDPLDRKPHACPSSDKRGHGGMGCGIYGFKSIGDLAWDFPVWGLPNWPKPGHPWTQLVWGKVLLWGKVYEHERGYRAEFARVHQLVHIPTLGSITDVEVSRVAEFYGVEFVALGIDQIDVIKTYLANRPDVASMSTMGHILFALAKQIAAATATIINRAQDLIEESRRASLAMQDLMEALKEDDDG